MKKELIITISALSIFLSSCNIAVKNPSVSPSPAPTEENIQSLCSPTPAPTLAPSEKYMTLDNKSSGWGFKKNKGSEPDIPAKIQEMLKKYDSYYMDTSREKVLYLTFDEGYENGHTGQILDVLKKHNVPAAFFVTGSYLKTEETLIHRMIDEGHIVGNHTLNHPNLPKLNTPEKMAEELLSLNKICDEKYGYTMKYMRPPEGEYSERVLAVAKDIGFKTVFWGFAYVDWHADVIKGADYAYSQIIPYLHNGEIILLHAVCKDNADALERIIDFASEQGYEFKSLDEIKCEE